MMIWGLTKEKDLTGLSKEGKSRINSVAYNKDWKRRFSERVLTRISVSKVYINSYSCNYMPTILGVPFKL